MVKVLVCGGGNGAHVLAGLGSSQPDTELRVFTMFADEAVRWTKAMEGKNFSVILHDPDQAPKTINAKPTMVTKDPAVAVPGCDIIIITVPAFAHQGYLDALKPHIKPGVILVGLPGQAGFQFAVMGSWGDLAKQCTIMAFESLPWAARIKEFGLSAEVLGTKDTLSGAAHIGTPNPISDPTALLQTILGPRPKLCLEGDILGITLMSMSAYIHPTIMYGRWHEWDGQGMDEAQLFYQAIDESTADLITAASDEVVAIAQKIMKQHPNVDLNNVIHLFTWYLRNYSKDIADKSNLCSAMRTNKAYVGLMHPMIKNADGKLYPNFGYRYLTEDVPCGLVVIKGIASITDVQTPTIDKILTWAQSILGKEYLVDGKLVGKNMKETRSPQAYGLTDLGSVLGQ